jgi:predicted nucleotidyltransferase component of viral defense system
MHTLIKGLESIKNELGQKGLDENTIRIFLKEELQNYLLDFIYESEEYKKMVFYGGTCLRRIYSLDRMSEDLDFESDLDLNLEQMGKDINEYFSKTLQYDDLDFAVQQGDIINRLTIKLPVLSQLDMSDYEDEKLHVKIEVNPLNEIKYNTVISPISVGQFTILVRHYDKPTLMAGKMLAALSRVFKKGNTGIKVKGRDYYDLIWYMSQEIRPNEQKLLDENPEYTTDRVFSLLKEKVEKINSRDLLLDLEPFFERKGYIRDWCDNFHGLFERYLEYYLN